jgi:hypothetical protein
MQHELLFKHRSDSCKQLKRLQRRLHRSNLRQLRALPIKTPSRIHQTHLP